MGNLELQLLLRMTDPNEIEEIASKVVAENFVDDDPINGAVFAWMLEYYATYHTAPSLDAIEERFTGADDRAVRTRIAGADSDDPTGFLIESLRRRFVRNQLQEMAISSTGADSVTDPIGALDRLVKDARAAQQAAGAHDALDDEFLTADQLDELPGVEWLIADVLPRDVYGLLRGRDRSFKSFIALDWALSLGTGLPWLDHAVTKVKTLYVVGEGARGHAARKKAWEEHHGVAVDPDWFVTRKSAVNLFRGGAAFEHLLGRIERDDYGLVVFDTLRRMSGGAEGNSSDMGIVVDNIDRVRRAMDGGTVLVPAHTDKGDHDTRGYSGIEDDADVVWASTREGDLLETRLSCEKMKDAPDGDVLDLALHRAGSSLAVTPADPSLRERLLGAVVESEEKVLSAMREAFKHTGASRRELMDDTEMTKSTLYRVVAKLLDRNTLVERKGRLWLPQEAQG